MVKCKRIATVIFIIILLAVISYQTRPVLSDKGLQIEACLKLDDTVNRKEKEFYLEVSINKYNNYHVVVYPYMKGLEVPMKQEQKNFLVPDELKKDEESRSIALNRLKEDNFIGTDEMVQLRGYWIPEGIGDYKTRVYLNLLDDFPATDQPVIVCVYYQRMAGRYIAGSKVIPVRIEIQ